jgi:hypothetical protein
MQKLALGLGLVAIVSMMSGCVGGGSAMNVASPIWEAGYSFSYQEQGSYAGASSTQGHTESEEGDFGPILRVYEVLNTTLRADEDPVYVAAYTTHDRSEEDAEEEPQAESGTTTMRAGTLGYAAGDVSFVGFRQTDLTEIPAWLELESDCDATGCTQNVGGLQFAESPEYSFLQFPLTKGKEWKADVDMPNGDDMFGEMAIRLEARVVGWKKVDTPLGSVKAVRVDWAMKPVDVAKYEREAREEAEDEGVELKKFNIEIERSGSVYFSEEYQTIVKSTYQGEYLVEVSGEAEGEEFDFSSRGRNAGEQVLEGVQLVAHAERGLDYFARLALGKATLNDPTGLAPEEVLYSLKVSADKTVVNAAEAESISFTAVPEGVQALPAGHKVAWRLLDASGSAIAKGTGLSFSHEFAEPGEYTAVAEAFDEDGKLTTSTSLTVFANYLKTVAVECPTVAAAIGPSQVAGQCEEATVPVRAGIQYLKVTADVVGPLSTAPIVNQASLVLSDSMGGSQSDSTRTDGGYSIELMMFLDFGIDGKDWTLQLQHSRGVMEQATYTIDLRYDSMPAAEMPMGMALAQSLQAFLGLA